MRKTRVKYIRGKQGTRRNPSVPAQKSANLRGLRIGVSLAKKAISILGRRK